MFHDEQEKILAIPIQVREQLSAQDQIPLLFLESPPGWGGCDPTRADNLDDLVGVRSSNGTGVGNQDLDNVTGYPQPYVDNDPSVTSETFQDFLDYTYALLAAQPNVKILPLDTPYLFIPTVDLTTTPYSCDRLQPLNMGEPWRNGFATDVEECYPYFPVVHGTAGRTKMAAGSRGQGTLLIDGDLELAGGFEWSGLIIVRGSVKILGERHRGQLDRRQRRDQVLRLRHREGGLRRRAADGAPHPELGERHPVAATPGAPAPWGFRRGPGGKEPPGPRAVRGRAVQREREPCECASQVVAGERFPGQAATCNVTADNELHCRGTGWHIGCLKARRSGTPGALRPRAAPDRRHRDALFRFGNSFFGCGLRR